MDVEFMDAGLTHLAPVANFAILVEITSHLTVPLPQSAALPLHARIPTNCQAAEMSDVASLQL